MPRRSPYAEYERAVALYTSAGGHETLQRVTVAISRLSKRLDHFYNAQLAELGVSHGEWTVLSTLAQNGRDGSSSPSQLADLSGVSPSTMTHRLDRMVERQLLTRTVDAKNRSRVKVVLARKGWELFRRAIVDAEVVEGGILSALGAEEQAQLADLLEKVVAGLPEK